MLAWNCRAVQVEHVLCRRRQQLLGSWPGTQGCKWMLLAEAAVQCTQVDAPCPVGGSGSLFGGASVVTWHCIALRSAGLHAAWHGQSGQQAVSGSVLRCSALRSSASQQFKCLSNQLSVHLSLCNSCAVGSHAMHIECVSGYARAQSIKSSASCIGQDATLQDIAEQLQGVLRCTTPG